ncbi:glycosyltransferase [Desulfurobacterium sp. TC5-1]|uniref:glycosyltransferase n=1 Tax=Desulfurobacterium sp. TC5-1 TaxID=1158318 RepID=UPI0003B3C255|nr:glycosyltransferase [Desulfurobacterium sp. TC5-1]
MIKLSVIMWDCGFRERFHAIKSYLNQTLDKNVYEVIWVEFYSDVKEEVKKFADEHPNFRILTLKRSGKWQYGICVNEGVRIAKGDILVISDGDVVVDEKFLEDELRLHEKYLDLPFINYHRRYDESAEPPVYRYDLEYLNKVCVLVNPTNYAGCFSIKKRDFVAINGYEEDMVFSGPSACAKDFYIRAKNAGYFIRWSPEKRLFHPWHPGTTVGFSYLLRKQERIMKIRDLNVDILPNFGFDKKIRKSKLDTVPDYSFKEKLQLFIEFLIKKAVGKI